MINIAIKNMSTSVSDADVKRMIAALQEQVSIDYKGVYGLDAKLYWFEKGASIPTGFWQLLGLENADQAGALGYHDKTKQGLPIGKIFFGTTLQYGGTPSVTASHELLEMLGDPWVNLSIVDPARQRAWNYEMCDAVEADELGYKRLGVQLSDFVKPSYFEPEVSGVSKGRSFCNHVKEAFELAPGGYMGFFDFVTNSWDQINAKKPEHHAGHGSRFGRRQQPHQARVISTAE